MVVLLLVLFIFLSSARADARSRDLWVYCPTNLLVDKNVSDLDALWHRAADAGYSHVLLADSKFARLGSLEGNERHYVANVERVKKIARDLHLQIVPAVFPIGYSNDLLYHDPNLAEGLPVRDQLFVVRDGRAEVRAEPPVELGRKPGWKDESVVIAADGVATVANPTGNARMVWTLRVAPFRCYHVGVQVKTAGFGGTPEIKAIADGGRNLQYQSLRVERTQDWKDVDVVFDSLDATGVKLYLGSWGDATGTLRWRNWRVEESPLVNVLRRPGAPLTVKGDGDGKAYVEGTDYGPVRDERLGNNPWPGEYDAWHAAPALVTHGIPDGARLRVSWYHPAIVYDEQVPICFDEPAAEGLLSDQARRMIAAWGAGGYMMSHDEIRVMNWDESCAAKHRTPGELLAANARFCTKLLGDADAYVWSDMFDPTHNAHDGYYLVNGDLAGSWEGLDPKVTVVNWNFEHRDASLKFFADRGHQQVIAGYYDGNVAAVKDWVAAADKVSGVVGVMYTTWRHNYDDLEAFARAVK